MTQLVDSQLPILESVVSDLLGITLTRAERVSGGQNSQIYKVDCGDDGSYAVKHYYRHPSDDRDRLGVEYSSLEFLWSSGIRSVPQPLAADKERQWAVYEWIEGEGIPVHQVADTEIDDAVQFLGDLRELANNQGTKNLQPASEACFSAQAVMDNVAMRLNKLKSSEMVEGQAEELQCFLADKFDPLFSDVSHWCIEHYARTGQSHLSKLPLADRTLSPSDFGFHNALKRKDGQIIFVDFEYFGWDDPAKTVSDFLLHPAMNLTNGLNQHFVDGIFARFPGTDRLVARVKGLYPLFGLKWCLIMLNEFLPEYLLRRNFAGSNNGQHHSLQVIQLAKAKRMLARVSEEYEQFPYKD